VTASSLMNFVVTDGNCIVASRFSTNDDPPASLYYAVGKRFECTDQGKGNFALIGDDGRPTVAMIASEPITDSLTDWVPVPVNHAVVMSKGINPNPTRRGCKGTPFEIARFSTRVRRLA
jgi:glutamine amidotransferase